MDNLIYWIWLSLCCAPAGSTFSTLLNKIGDAKAVYEAEEYEILACLDPKNPDRAYLINKDLQHASEIYNFCKKRGVGLLAYCDDKYPVALRKIQNPPPILYYRGVLPDFNSKPFVSVVGTRSLSDYGRKNAFKISYDIACAGVSVVSGMAKGIDGVATAGAIAAEGSTVAILGSGIDVCYPKQHLTLAREIVKEGCILTEFPPATPPMKQNFPKRNRIISAISSATFVVEGPEGSGALITARCAKEQGKPVFALPANISSKQSEVTTLLLKNGAKPCTMAEDILRELETEFPSQVNLFKLSARCPVDMMHVLRTLKVDANCPNDDIYSPSKITPRGYNSTRAAQRSLSNNPSQSLVPEHREVQVQPSLTEQAPVLDLSEAAHVGTEKGEEFVFDKLALKLYKRIPQRGGCEIESLVDDKTPLREVMRLLLKLEMGKFVVLTPGDRVERKTK
ncbi:MAG: DNA-processing protein DprA [Clostridia bacterium]|nr:DNA-processing protein DprA [Clostridia bacterium]